MSRSAISGGSVLGRSEGGFGSRRSWAPLGRSWAVLGSVLGLGSMFITFQCWISFGEDFGRSEDSEREPLGHLLAAKTQRKTIQNRSPSSRGKHMIPGIVWKRFGIGFELRLV